MNFGHSKGLSDYEELQSVVWSFRALAGSSHPGTGSTHSEAKSSCPEGLSEGQFVLKEKRLLLTYQEFNPVNFVSQGINQDSLGQSGHSKGQYTCCHS